MQSAEQTQPTSLPAAVVEKLKAAIGDKHVLTDPDELLVYEADALTIHKHIPSAVVIPGTAEEVAAVVKIIKNITICEKNIPTTVSIRIAKISLLVILGTPLPMATIFP